MSEKTNAEHIVRFTYKHDTPKAICVTADDTDIWFPKSQVTPGREFEGIQKGGEFNMKVPEWLLDSNDLGHLVKDEDDIP